MSDCQSRATWEQHMNAEQESITEPDAELIALGSRLEGLLQDYFAAHLEWAPGLDDAASARIWALDDERNLIAEKIMSLPVASIAGLRAKVLVMLWEALPIWSNVGRLQFNPDDGGASEALFRAAAELTGLGLMVRDMEARLAAVVATIAAAPADLMARAASGRPFALGSNTVQMAGGVCPTLMQKSVTMHVLRHSAAMRLLHAGIDTSVIALWLGHENVETTQVYLHADLAIKERALARTTPAETSPGRFRPTDKLLAFLEALSITPRKFREGRVDAQAAERGRGAEAGKENLHRDEIGRQACCPVHPWRARRAGPVVRDASSPPALSEATAMKVTLTLTKKGETLCREVREVADAASFAGSRHLEWPRTACARSGHGVEEFMDRVNDAVFDQLDGALLSFERE